ncbi:hypothetical protein LEP1GSC067_0815 [Leptospira interrogans serovar Lora str. TE 1992]|uniref:Uncharacterized protein n=1 Tax=Leptospira interrogans serovar Lora str. TE 1992 TaxID=1193028 RepID=M3E288_LEPIR|nr:hypothetical protein LEP1GSC067_0815 [Leptospira interrogans serovar Lora str. TE 1992]EMN08784.1 hypothetical protein LEP1GSC053_1938 [Leptospira interrogans serovar Muenchen str. Brem 129]
MNFYGDLYVKRIFFTTEILFEEKDFGFLFLIGSIYFDL